MSEKIGQRIRRLRHEHGLTQAALAGERLSESYVSLIESGRRTPTDEVLEYLAQTLGCSVEILKGVDQVSDAAQAEMLIRRAEWETESGQSQTALRHLQQGITLASTLDLPALATRGRAARAKALEMTGQLREYRRIM
jgi:transcriptional regulator with XRE-family HTH domain